MKERDTNKRRTSKSVLLSTVFAASLALSCSRETNSIPLVQVFPGSTEVTQSEKLKRADLDEILSQSIRPDFMGTAKSMRSELINGGVQWRFQQEHNQFGESKIDTTDLVVNIFYEKTLNGERILQYTIQVTGLNEVSKGNLGKHFKIQKEDDPSKSKEVSVVKTIDTTPSKITESSIEKAVEKPQEELTAVELLKGAAKYFILPSNPSAKVERPAGVNLAVVQATGKNPFGWDTEVTVNTLGAAELKAKRIS